MPDGFLQSFGTLEHMITTASERVDRRMAKSNQGATPWLHRQQGAVARRGTPLQCGRGPVPPCRRCQSKEVQSFFSAEGVRRPRRSKRCRSHRTLQVDHSSRNYSETEPLSSIARRATRQDPIARVAQALTLQGSSSQKPSEIVGPSLPDCGLPQSSSL